MKIKELIKELKTLNQEGNILISSDEELNTLFKKFEIGILKDDESEYCLYGLSGSEKEDDDDELLNLVEEKVKQRKRR